MERSPGMKGNRIISAVRIIIVPHTKKSALTLVEYGGIWYQKV
jgi:hypothetical protein